MIYSIPVPAEEIASYSSPDAPHILLVLDQFPKSLGGGERIVLRLAELLPKRGFRVSILTFSIHPESAVYAALPACPVYVLPLQRTYGFTAFRAALALGRFVRRQKVQIVQTFFESSDLWAGPVVKVLSNAKLIWSRRDMGILRGRKHHLAYRMLAWLPDQVFAVSGQVCRHCIDVDGVHPEKARITYNGLDIPEAAGASRQFDTSTGAVITTVGNIRRVKGHDILIQAAAVVVKRFPKVTFTIAGEVLEPAYFAELEQLIADLHLEGRVRFVGGVTALVKHLQTADIFALPSRSEGFSNAIVEAMAAGLPVIATNVGGNAEGVEDGITGLIVPPEDPRALAEGICRLLDNPEAAQGMGIAGKQRVVDHFTTEAMMSNICRIYAALLKDGNLLHFYR